MIEFSLQNAKFLDRMDPLRKFREQFNFPKAKTGKSYLYFCGNSLGLQPKKTKQYIDEEVQAWAKWGVEGHFHAKRPWLSYHEIVTKSLARLVGASPDEVVAMNSLTVNLHLLFAAFYRPTSQRNLILIEENTFPSDEYAVASQAQLHDFLPRKTVIHTECTTEAVVDAIARNGKKISIVWIGHVNYLTGYRFDLARIAKAAHKFGCLFGVDLAHGIGNVPLNLHRDQVDFATWCSYKYLNSGPGGISGIFVHQRHGNNTRQPRLSGWWGHDKGKRFRMEPVFKAISGAEGFQLSNPPIFQLAALRSSLDLFDAAGMNRLRKKSLLLTGFLEKGLRRVLPEVEIFTSPNPEERGCQLSLRIRSAPKKLTKKLAKHGVICDFREPDVVRVAPAPLYVSYEDVYRFVMILKKVLG